MQCNRFHRKNYIICEGILYHGNVLLAKCTWVYILSTIHLYIPTFWAYCENNFRWSDSRILWYYVHKNFLIKWYEIFIAIKMNYVVHSFFFFIFVLSYHNLFIRNKSTLTINTYYLSHIILTQLFFNFYK